MEDKHRRIQEIETQYLKKLEDLHKTNIENIARDNVEDKETLLKEECFQQIDTFKQAQLEILATEKEKIDNTRIQKEKDIHSRYQLKEKEVLNIIRNKVLTNGYR